MSDMYALTAIENVAKYLPRAVANGADTEARERVAFANNLSGAVMTFCSTTAEHSLEHAMSAYHQELPHGAGLIMISKAFYEFFIEKHAVMNDSSKWHKQWVCRKLTNRKTLSPCW